MRPSLSAGLASISLLSLLSLIALGASGCRKEGNGAPTATTNASAALASAKPPPSGEVVGRSIAVVADDHGFSPASISVAKGEQVTLVFTRTTEDTCATAVVFPELKLKKDLPLMQSVAVVVPTGEAKTYGFECGMGMYKSKLVVQ
jgi:hypothetical protein